jgi:hypothetical protein
MKVVSEERSTGRGAIRFSAILLAGEFVRVSEIQECVYLGRESGVEKYEIEVPEGTVTADFYRSNSGKEDVWVSTGESFQSFEAAQKWARGGIENGR